jgi:hypothetical protein
MPFRFESLDIWHMARAYATNEVVGASFLALDRGYITVQEQRSLYEDGEQIGKSINAFRNTLK